MKIILQRLAEYERVQKPPRGEIVFKEEGATQQKMKRKTVETKLRVKHKAHHKSIV